MIFGTGDPGEGLPTTGDPGPGPRNALTPQQQAFVRLQLSNLPPDVLAEHVRRLGLPDQQSSPLLGMAKAVGVDLPVGIWNTVSAPFKDVFSPTTVDEARNPILRANMRAHGVDPDAELHAAILRRAHGEPEPGDRTLALARGAVTSGFDAERSLQDAFSSGDAEDRSRALSNLGILTALSAWGAKKPSPAAPPAAPAPFRPLTQLAEAEGSVPSFVRRGTSIDAMQRQAGVMSPQALAEHAHIQAELEHFAKLPQKPMDVEPDYTPRSPDQPSAPNVGRAQNLITDWRKGIPPVRELEKGLPKETPDGILPDVQPGSILKVAQRDLPQVPWPKKVATTQRQIDQIRMALEHPNWMGDIRRGVEIGGHNWYTADPVAASAMQVLGPVKGRAAFEEWANMMGPTALQTDPIQNMRNAGYRYVTKNEPFTQGPPGYAQLYPTMLGKHLGELANTGSLDPMRMPKLSRFVENIKGNWQPGTLDTHEARRIIQLGADLPDNPESYYGPFESLYQQAAEQAHSEGTLPVPEGFSPTAAAQAARWTGGAGETGVRGGQQRAVQSISDLFARSVFRTAHHTGMSPAEVLQKFWTRQHPLF